MLNIISQHPEAFFFYSVVHLCQSLFRGRGFFNIVASSVTTQNLIGGSVRYDPVLFLLLVAAAVTRFIFGTVTDVYGRRWKKHKPNII